MSGINCPVNLSNKNLTQYNFNNNQNTLLQMPLDVLNVIMCNVCDEPSAMKSAIRALEFGRVSALTHLLTHANPEIDSLIHDERKFLPLVNCLAKKLNRDADPLGVVSDFGPGDVGEMVGLLNLAQEEYVNDLPKIFYTIFKRSVESISSKEYLEFAGDDNWAFLGLGAKILRVWDDQDFAEKIHHDLIKSFVSKPVENLTLEAYNDFVKTLNTAYGRVSPQDNERILRQAIYSTYEKEQLDALKEKYENPSGELLATTEENLRDKRNQRKIDIDMEIRRLCGDNFNGTIDNAYRAMQAAEAEKVQAKTAYIANSQGFTVDMNDTEFASRGCGMQDLFSKYIQKLGEYGEAREAFDTRKARLDTLAVWREGVITGGAILDIQAELREEKLAAYAQSICKKASGFYAQLSRPIDEDNKDELYEQLHEIIG